MHQATLQSDVLVQNHNRRMITLNQLPLQVLETANCQLVLQRVAPQCGETVRELCEQRTPEIKRSSPATKAKTTT